MAEVILDNLTKSYPPRSGGTAIDAVKGINLSIADKEFMVLVGPSGCGKSTTLRLIAGLEEQDSGSISIGGRNVNGVPPKDRDIAMVFQNYALYPHMSVRQNMAFGLTLRKMPAKDIEERVQGASSLLGLGGMLDRRPKELSGGQRQRVALGRAIVRHPKVFLFDEPLSNLDAQMRVAMRAEISRLHLRLGATMVYVTHDQVEAMTMGDRICVMNAGRIMQVADPLTLYNHPANRFVAGFIGTPSMNFFSGSVRANGSGAVFSESNAGGTAFSCALTGSPSAADGRPVILGIRAENINVAEAGLPAIGSAEAGRLSSGTATVELSEPMGPETFLYLTTGATSFVARVAPEARFAPGDKVSVSLDGTRVHLFDAATGVRL